MPCCMAHPPAPIAPVAAATYCNMSPRLRLARGDSLEGDRAERICGTRHGRTWDGDVLIPHHRAMIKSPYNALSPQTLLCSSSAAMCRKRRPPNRSLEVALYRGKPEDPRSAPGQRLFDYGNVVFRKVPIGCNHWQVMQFCSSNDKAIRRIPVMQGKFAGKCRSLFC